MTISTPTTPVRHSPGQSPSESSSHSPQRLLGWTFRRGAQSLTCELLCASNQEYAVILTPHWATGAILVEELSNGVNAFHRHAAIAMQLRQQGWTVVAYAPLPSPRTPASQRSPLAA
jgi:hypothetical protein